MGCTMREKHTRSNRRARPVKPEVDHSSDLTADANVENSEIMASDFNPENFELETALVQDSNSDLKSSQESRSAFNESGWGYCTEDQLQEILIKNLDFLYNDAMNKLVALGYDEEVALKAILRNGHCYGGMDILTNIVHNSLSYLNTTIRSQENASNDNEKDPKAFLSLRQMEDFSLAGMVCMLQQVKPNLSRGDAMWCLLMSDLHLGRASVMEVPTPPPTSANGGSVGVTAALCKFHGGWGFGNDGTSEFPTSGHLSHPSDIALQKDIDCPERFNLSSPMKSLLKRNVAMFAAGFRANSKQFQIQAHTCPNSLSSGDSSHEHGSVVEVLPGHVEESQFGKSRDVVNSVMSKFKDLNLEETAEQVSMDQKDEMILSLVHQIKDLEKQVKEQKEWAHQKAIQAARKLNSDLTELKTLKMEREETQRMRNLKQTLEDSTMKRLSEMENALRKASGQVDRANAAVRKLETDNAEIRAEMEASKLSTSESVASTAEISKREKKCLKKLVAWEKQKAKMQEDIAAEKLKISELQQQMAMVGAATKNCGEKWRLEQKAKELAITKLDAERRLKEGADSNNKRKVDALRLKIEVDLQRQRDDIRRLEQEFGRLKDSEKQWTDINLQSDGINPHAEVIANLLNDLDQLEEDSPEYEASCDRECMFCMKREVSVVFLPCAHQVICANCDDSYGKKGKAMCPFCRIPIDQRVRVYGASS